MSVFSGSWPTRQPRKHLGYYIGIEGWLVLLHRGAKPAIALVPEDMLDGRSKFFRLRAGFFRLLLVSETCLRVRHVLQRRVYFHVVHKQGHVISFGNVIDTQPSIS